MTRVLVVDDEVKLGKLVAEALSLDGCAVTRADDGQAALNELDAREFDVVLTDLKMPIVDGLQILRHARGKSPPPEVVLMTAYGSAESAVEAMKAGAADYLVKPFSMDELRLRVRRLSDHRRAEQKSRHLVERLTPSLIARSARMREVLAAARQVAATDATVLLLGESGTGKTELARFIHYSSRRAQGRLVEIHCAALPEALLESELFGHEKGAFTGAQARRAGHLAAADGGTAFLDEIGEVTVSTQVKLLRFLQDRELVPVGSTEPRRVDVRIIAATNRDLAASVQEGRFREDFYYRLNVFTIRLPPLRERADDVLPLAEAFLARRGLPAAKLSPDARACLVSSRWPGNVRELYNALERALILAGEDDIRASHFDFSNAASPLSPSNPAALLVDGFNLDAFERSLLHAAIERAGGNKTLAAKLLGITRRRLYSRLQSLDEKLKADD